MNESTTNSDKNQFDLNVLGALRLGLILLITYWCYKIVAPFIPLLLWGAIIAVATYPLHLKLTARLGNRIKMSAVLMTLIGLIILTVPVIVLTDSLMDSSMHLAAQIDEGAVHIPKPPERVREWPLVGEKLHSSWQQASANLGAALDQFAPQLEAVQHRLIAIAGGAGAAFLQLFFSIIIAGVLLAVAESSMAGVRLVAHWLGGDRSNVLLSMSEATVRSVARGILGVAIIESVLSAIGLFVADVPAAGFWTFLILVLSIIQIPPLLVLIPMALYVLATAEPFGATVFVILSIVVIAVDTFLKPVLLGRTVDAPMLVILMGAIGGMMLAGIVGLFVGSVVLVVGWELLQFALEREIKAAHNENPEQLGSE